MLETGFDSPRNRSARNLALGSRDCEQQLRPLPLWGSSFHLWIVRFLYIDIRYYICMLTEKQMGRMTYKNQVKWCDSRVNQSIFLNISTLYQYIWENPGCTLVDISTFFNVRPFIVEQVIKKLLEEKVTLTWNTKGEYKIRLWSAKHNLHCCMSCNTMKTRHEGGGLCMWCYRQKRWIEKDTTKDKQRMRRYYQKTKDLPSSILSAKKRALAYYHRNKDVINALKRYNRKMGKTKK